MLHFIRFVLCLCVRVESCSVAVVAVVFYFFHHFECLLAFIYLHIISIFQQLYNKINRLNLSMNFMLHRRLLHIQRIYEFLFRSYFIWMRSFRYFSLARRVFFLLLLLLCTDFSEKCFHKIEPMIIKQWSEYYSPHKRHILEYTLAEQISLFAATFEPIKSAKNSEQRQTLEKLLHQ